MLKRQHQRCKFGFHKTTFRIDGYMSAQCNAVLQFAVRSVFLLNTGHSQMRHGHCTYEAWASEPKRCKAVESTHSTLKKRNNAEENPKQVCNKFPQLWTGLGPTSSYPMQCTAMLLVVTFQAAFFEWQDNKNKKVHCNYEQAFTYFYMLSMWFLAPD